MNKRLFTQMRSLSVFALLLSANLIWAQSQTPLDIALRHIEQNHKSWNLTKEDITDMVVTNSHISSISGTAHIYFQQRHQGINVTNAILNVSITSDGKVLHTGKRFTADVASKVNTTSSRLDAEAALQSTLRLLEMDAPASFTVKENRSNEVVFDKGTFANRDVKAKLVYVYDKDGNLNLAWEVVIDPVRNADYWYMYVDALTGKQLGKSNLLKHCRHAGDLDHKHSTICKDELAAKPKSIEVTEALASTNNALTNSYRVFALPTESPLHGPHVVVTDPADMGVSPLGWHSTGQGGGFNYTRGNNVHVYLDADGDGAADEPEPNGGASRDFDFPYSPDLEPANQKEAGMVNLFYMGNMMHDFAYHYGFDEPAGNFQFNNLGNGGSQLDQVFMQAQWSSSLGTLNDATFVTPPDGENAVMNSYVWDINRGLGIVGVTAPSTIAGNYDATTANFGPPVDENPVCGEVVIANDGIFNPYATDGCEPIWTNGADFEGKIALIDRGGCFFQDKAAYAESYGAIGVIICNFEDVRIGMAGAGEQPVPTIPSVMMGATDCQTIRQFAGNGLELCLVIPEATGPVFTDGAFDNGLIAHEYSHGITERLTGGASNVTCLTNPDSLNEGFGMAEGWGDFFALAVTVEEGDDGEDLRGTGAYALKLPDNGKGLLRYSYSTNISVNPLTYGEARFSPFTSVVGQIWGSALWDLYWAMVDEYDWDANLNTGTGGNNMTIKLVMEGLKTQPCNPGFLDGRDAILAADVALYSGANACLIWEVFARRGIGYYADQGDPLIIGDEIEDFEPLPTCIPELKITKTVTPLIDAGDIIDVSLLVINHKPETLTGIVVTDALVDGLSYVAGSANITEVAVSGSDLIFTIGDMAYLDEVSITYQLATSPDIFSIQKEFDAVEYDLGGSIEWWVSDIISGSANTQFNLTDQSSYDGEQSWFIEEIVEETEHQLLSTKIFSISGDRPTARFYHQYNLAPGFNGGLFEITTDGGANFQILDDEIFIGAYPERIDYGTFVIPNLDAFSGNSNGYVAAYVDLSDYVGQDVSFRFHFRTPGGIPVANEGGWNIDAFEIMDLKSYKTSTCVTSDQGDMDCIDETIEGSIIESQIQVVSVNDPEASVQVGVFPNPADEVINVTIASKYAQNVNLSVVTLDGREVMSKEVGTSRNTETFSLDVSQLAAGFYFVKAATNQEIVIEKVVIK